MHAKLLRIGVADRFAGEAVLAQEKLTEETKKWPEYSTS